GSAMGIGKRSFLTRANHIFPHVGYEYFGHAHAAIALLVVFNDRRPDTGRGEGRSIQRVHKLIFLRRCATEASIATPRLKISELPDGGYLKPSIDPRRVYLKVIDLCRREGQISSA